MNKRLLTDEEIEDAWLSGNQHWVDKPVSNNDDFWYGYDTDGRRGIAKAQDVETLKAVGEWLGVNFGWEGEDLETLKRGGMPDEK